MHSLNKIKKLLDDTGFEFHINISYITLTDNKIVLKHLLIQVNISFQ